MTCSLPSEHESIIHIQGVEIALGFPDEFQFEWIGQKDVLDQLTGLGYVNDEQFAQTLASSASGHKLP